MDKERLARLKEQFDFLNLGEGSLPRDFPGDDSADFGENKAGIQYDKEEDDFYGEILRKKRLKQIEDIEKKGKVLWYAKENSNVPEVDKNYGSDVNSLGSTLEECLKSGKTNTECIELQKRLERTGKWDGELTGKISSDFGLSKKAKQDLLRVRESAERIKNLEDFGYALRSLKNEIVGRKFTDYMDYKVSTEDLLDSIDFDYEDYDFEEY